MSKSKSKEMRKRKKTQVNVNNARKKTTHLDCQHLYVAPVVSSMMACRCIAYSAYVLHYHVPGSISSVVFSFATENVSSPSGCRRVEERFNVKNSYGVMRLCLCVVCFFSLTLSFFSSLLHYTWYVLFNHGTNNTKNCVRGRLGDRKIQITYLRITLSPFLSLSTLVVVVVLTLSHRYNAVRGLRTGSGNSGAEDDLRRKKNKTEDNTHHN